MSRSSAAREIGLYPGYGALEDYAYFLKLTKRYPTSNVPMMLIKYEVSSSANSTIKRRQPVKNRIELLLENFYFDWYPIYGLIRNALLLFLPRSVTTSATRILWR